VPLLVAESTSSAVENVLVQDPLMLVWWATEVECASAIARLEHEDSLSEKAILLALQRLDALTQLGTRFSRSRASESLQDGFYVCTV
jgi:hypothetical protein